MTRPRLIPVLLLKHGLLVRSQQFRLHQAIGNPMSTIQRLSNWNVDELVLIDISDDDFHDLRRDDLQQSYQGSTALDVLREITKVCFMPLAFGGRIRSLYDIELRLQAGADKCIINTQALETPEFVSTASKRFGAQCIVVNIDFRREENGEVFAWSNGGKKKTEWTATDWAREVEARGAGEIFLNSIERDGMATGYDLELIREITDSVGIPVIACGGVGGYGDMPKAILEGGASAAAAANIYHFFELSYPVAKKHCLDANIPMRPVSLESRWCPRTPEYPDAEKEKRLNRAKLPLNLSRYSGALQRPVKWCKRCLYPSISATPLEFDEHGVCTGCLMADKKKEIPATEWEERSGILREIVDQYRSKDGSNYDCVIPVSGGKDSYFQVHVLKEEFGLNPLLVTYNGNNWTKSGWKNVHRMKEVFGVDHIFYSPSVPLLKKLNRLGFYTMGDMNWHAHVGIMSLPMRVAAQHRIPLVFYGEHGYLDLGGQFSMNDFPEVSYRDRLEHFARGFDESYFVGVEGITAQDMLAYRYPLDGDMFDLYLRGLFLGNYVYWEANEHAEMVRERYGFEASEEPFDRTYRTMSNLDDMHENGAHDYLKYIKFGYGRCSDHVCKDIRAGKMTKEEGIKRILHYDHVRPRDLERWFDYADVNAEDFDRAADTFRDPRIWRIVDSHWVKTDVDGIQRSYEEVRI